MYGFNTPAVLIRTGIGEVLSPGDKCRDADQSVGMLNAECCPVSYRDLSFTSNIVNRNSLFDIPKA